VHLMLMTYASLYWELVVHQDRDVPSVGNVVHVLLHLTHSPALAENRKSLDEGGKMQSL
jgi:hypothetical protein